MTVSERFTTAELQKILAAAGSWSRFKEMLGLSSLQLNELRREHPIRLDVLTGVPPSSIATEMERIGSVSLFCIIYGCRGSELRKVCADNGIDLKKLIRPIGATAGTGRLGEIFFKSCRGEAITEDCFETRGHTAPFDFVDSAFGLVNVKTARRRKWKAKTRSDDPFFWDFNIEGCLNCDYLALVPLDARNMPSIVVMVRSHPTLAAKKHFLFTAKGLRVSAGTMIAVDPPRVYQWIGPLIGLESPEQAGG